MAGTRKVGGLEIDQDLVFQRREWRAEKIGWAVLALVLVAALLGVFSVGPLSAAAARDDAGIARVSYDRFARYKAPARLEVRVARAAAEQGELHVRISSAYLTSVQVNSVTPQPASVETDGDVIDHVFALAPGGGDVTVAFDIQIQKLGLVRGAVWAGDAGPVEFAQLVYP